MLEAKAEDSTETTERGKVIVVMPVFPAKDFGPTTRIEGSMSSEPRQPVLAITVAFATLTV